MYDGPPRPSRSRRAVIDGFGEPSYEYRRAVVQAIDGRGEPSYIDEMTTETFNLNAPPGFRGCLRICRSGCTSDICRIGGRTAQPTL